MKSKMEENGRARHWKGILGKDVVVDITVCYSSHACFVFDPVFWKLKVMSFTLQPWRTCKKSEVDALQTTFQSCLL